MHTVDGLSQRMKIQQMRDSLLFIRILIITNHGHRKMYSTGHTALVMVA